MQFSHAAAIWNDYPELVPGVLFVKGISTAPSVDAAVLRHCAIATSRLAGKAESDLPEIQAWRRTFSKMGLKPTQYRSASEALLRRFRKEGNLPRIHPLIDLCNAISLAFAVPIAVFDASKIATRVEVRYATGKETYLAFSGDEEHPDEGEVIFADDDGQAHARRWTNRQSATSAIRADTAQALIVAEALHDTADADVRRLVDVLATELGAAWQAPSATAILDSSRPRFGF